MATNGVNKAIILGNLGQDPEFRELSTDSSVMNITIATSESWQDKDKNWQERTEWHRAAIFLKGGQVKYWQDRLKKGDKVYLEGKLQTRKWTDQEGKERYTTEIIVQSFDGTLQKVSESHSSQGGQGSSQTPQAPQQSAPKQQSAPQQSAPQAPQPQQEPPMDDDDDIPF